MPQLSRFLFLLLGTYSTAIYAKTSKAKGHTTRVEIKTPVDMEVCFSPEEPCDAKLAKFVESAQKSIDIAVFDINLDQLTHQILVKSKSIPVRIVVDKRQAQEQYSLVSTLIKGGEKVKYGRQKGLMHNKFTIVDGKMLQTGSFNYTNHASTSNAENQLYIANQAVVDKYILRFQVLWDNAKDVEEKPKAESMKMPVPLELVPP